MKGTMLAWQLQSLGSWPEPVQIPIPRPGPGQVLVRIAACGLNHADLLMIEGRYQERPPLPLVLGMEAAGEVVALGDGVPGPKAGSRVAVFGAAGGLAEYAVFAASHCLVLPDTMSFQEAAAFQIGFGTSHLALRHRARLGAGETLFVTGAAGGVGLTAVQIGRRLGARVIASARGPDRLEVARAAGADHLIDSAATPDLRAALEALGGVDVVYDTVGGADFLAALRACRPEGRLIPIGFAGGDVPQIPANLLLVRNLDVIGLYWGGYMRFRPGMLRDSLAELIGWHATGDLPIPIGARFPLAQAGHALGLLRNRAVTGKIVIET
jgi:NADPH2:quinone reductase